MPTRKEQLFSAKKTSPDTNIIPATVRFRHNKKKGLIEPLSAQEKMLCALRKALAAMSTTAAGRYYIAGNKVQIIAAPTSTVGKAGGAQSYRASGRCRVGVARADGVTMKVIQFTISYRDIKDDRGLADIEYFDPTTIDELPRNTPLNIAGLSA